MGQIQPDVAYSFDDHTFRERDPYARAKYDLTLRWLSQRLTAGSVLYNVGVGSGYFNHLAHARGVRVVGCEPDRLAYETAVATAPPSTEIVNLGLEDFARGRAPADVVVMHDVLEHIEDDRKAARELYALVRKGGVAVVSVPALPSLYGIHDEQLGHYRRYTKQTLIDVLRPHFEIRRLQWYGLASIPIAFYYSRWRRKPYPLGAAQNSLLGNVYAAVCRIEGHIAEPIGTALIVELQPRG